jgi:tryptophan 2,3-dioxygenase
MILLGDEANLLCQHIQTSFYRKINESSRYFDMLTTSFCVMEDGMEVEQYMKFRNTLISASGAKVQYR